MLLYVKDGGSVSSLIKDNPFAKGIRYNGKQLWDYTEQTKIFNQEKISISRFESCPSAAVMISCTFQDDSRGDSDYIIVGEERYQNDTDIFYYASPIGLELLSAAFVSQRYGFGTLDGHSFRVISKRLNERDSNRAPLLVIRDYFEIKKDGGFQKSITRKSYEIDDVLLYSLREGRFETIRTTYDTSSGHFFTDISLFREYVQKYGKPSVIPVFCNERKGDGKDFNPMRFENMKTESILKGYGYSVSERDDLTKDERQAILAEIVDLELLKPAKVADYLSFFIRSHGGPRYDIARSKWESDLSFIQEYRVDKNRFLIVT